MAEIGLRERMIVKDVMSSPAISIEEDSTVDNAAQQMDKYNLGCIVVTNKDGKPLGIITERDLVRRVLAKNALPSNLAVKEVMSSPLITVEPDEKLSEVARRMSRLNIRRLGVMYRGELIGVVSSQDILAVTPELIETIQEKTRIESNNITMEPATSSLTGYCDVCGGWSDDLREAEGQFLCDECRIELGGSY